MTQYIQYFASLKEVKFANVLLARTVFINNLVINLNILFRFSNDFTTFEIFILLQSFPPLIQFVGVKHFFLLKTTNVFLYLLIVLFPNVLIIDVKYIVSVKFT